MGEEVDARKAALYCCMQLQTKQLLALARVHLNGEKHAKHNSCHRALALCWELGICVGG